MDAALLRSIPMFSSLSAAELSALTELLETRRFAARQPVVFLGEDGAELFVVQSGKVLVSYPDESGKEVRLAEIGPGGFFGEISILDGGPRTADVRAVADSVLLVLKREKFVQFLRAHTGVTIHILAVQGQRQRDLLARLRGIRNVNDAVAVDQSPLQRWLVRIANTFANEKFLLGTLLAISTWITVNLGLRRIGDVPFDDPPTFFWLGFLISVEAIVIGLFVLNAQHRQGERDRIRADLEYQMNVKAHLEILELQRKMDRLLELVKPPPPGMP